jgi:signal transduction histidine kinase
VRERLEEVRESRVRIVRAGYEERRRLERDLHDGAQQRLVALGMSLRRVQRARGTAPEVAEAIDSAVSQVVGAVEELREIARGLRPGALDDGLGPALAELRRRTPLPMDVDAPEGRLPLEVEAAAYYVVLEAVANAVKHAEASRISVLAERRNGNLCLRVSDDGRGGADARAGGGIAGLADRISAHGGALMLESPPGGGTSLQVTLPCA